MEINQFEIIIGFTVLLLSIYYYFTFKFNFWKKRNVVGPKPIPFFGNMKDVIFGKIHFGLLLKQYYDEFKSESIIGFFNGKNPALIIKDLDLVQDILVKNFKTFCDRGLYNGKTMDISEKNILNLEYKNWKPLRKALTPLFSSNKYTIMINLLNNYAQKFEKYLENICEKCDSTECHKLGIKFTTNTLSMYMFSLNGVSDKDGNDIGVKLGSSLVSSLSIQNVFYRNIRLCFPKVYELLIRFNIITRQSNFFSEFIKCILNSRNKDNRQRDDFLDFLLNFKDQNEKMDNYEFNDENLMAQIQIFFAAGFETSASILCVALYELALNLKIQDELRKEVQKEYEACGGQWTVQSLKNMTYLDKIVKETLRKYPPLGDLQRKSSSSYKFANTNISIPKDTTIYIPVFAIHRDPNIYASPDTFDPERFSEENVKLRHPLSFLTFGDGPHNCIGFQLGYYQVKFGIISLINKFKVEKCEKTCIPFDFSPKSIVLISPKNGIHLKITKL